MNSSLFTVSLFILLWICKGEYEEDLKGILKFYDSRDPNCTFNYTEINSTTIKYFPKCSHVYGLIVINSNTDLVIGQLNTAFSRLWDFSGGIRIENTKFTSMNIFTGLSVCCEYYGFYVINNTELSDAGFLRNLGSGPIDPKEDSHFYIEKNPKLDVEVLCAQGFLSELTSVKTKGNLRNCGCQGDEINSLNLPEYAECTTLYNGLNLYNLTDISSLSALSNIQSIRGNIRIENTLIQNLSFLDNLKSWDVRNKDNLLFDIQNNSELTSLPNSFFKAVVINYGGGRNGYPVSTGNIERPHPDFCISIEQFLLIFDKILSFTNLQAKICNDVGNIGKNVLCHFKSMRDLPNYCDIILGNVFIESGDENDMTKLQSISRIFGSAMIRNTSLRDLNNFGGNLDIVSLDDSLPAIQIVGNKKLKSIIIHSLGNHNLITRGNRDVVIQDNNPALFSKGEPCHIITQQWNDSQVFYRTRMNIIGSDCGDPNCTFNYTVINSTTIKYFPKCSHVYGLIVINSNTDLIVAQLSTAFIKLSNFSGGVRIENTKFTTMNMFAGVAVFCESYGFYVINNTQLFDAVFLRNLRWKPMYPKEDYRFYIENNPKLDVEALCAQGFLSELTSIKTRGNLRNCGCQGDEITSSNLPEYTECTTLHNGLKLFNLTDVSSLSALSNIESIRGNILIENTLIQNLSFLNNLKSWDVRNNDNLLFDIRNNSELTSLPNSFFKAMVYSDPPNRNGYPVATGNIERPNPDFCISIEQFLLIFDKTLSFTNLHAKLCNDIGDIDNRVLCHFKSMRDLPNNCEIIVGNVIIDNGDEDDITKLIDTSLIFGSLIIRNTNLEYLITWTLSLLMNLITRGNRDVVVQDNNPALFSNGEQCQIIAKGYNSLQIFYRTRMNFIGADCGGERVEIKSSSGWNIRILFVLSISKLLL